MKQNKRFYLAALVLLLVGLLAVGAASAATYPTITGVTFDEANAPKLYVNSEANWDYYTSGPLKANVTFTAGDTNYVEYNWNSSDTSIIDISNWDTNHDTDGISFTLRPYKVGKAIITVTAIDKNTDTPYSKSIELEVVEMPEVKEYNKVTITGFPEDKKIKFGSEWYLDWDKNDLKTPGKTDGVATWTSSDTKIARIDNNGVLYPESVGDVTIKLSVKGAGAEPLTDQVALTIVANEEEGAKHVNATSIAFNDPTGYTLTVGEKISFGYYPGAARFVSAEPNNAEPYSRYFMSSNEKVVSSGMHLEAVSAGEATVTATWINYDGTAVSTTCKIEVVGETVKKPVTGIVFLNDNITLYTDTPIDTYDLFTLTPLDHDSYTARWTSSNSKVVTIKDGYIEGLKASNEPVTLTLTIYNEEGDPVSKALTIKEVKDAFVPVTGVAFYEKSLTVAKDESLNISRANTFRVTPNNASGIDDYYWTPSDPDIVRVDGNYVKGIKAGKATLTLTYRDMEGQDYFTADPIEIEVTEETIVPVTGINFIKKEITAKKGDSDINLFDYLKKTWFEPADYTWPKTILWTSSDLTVAEVDQGYLYAVGVGKATLTMTVVNADDSVVTGDVTITVTDPDAITKLSFASSPLTVKVGNEINLFSYPSYAYPYLTMIPKTADRSLIYWTTSNADVAYVTKDGVLVPVAAGTATITATAGENTASLEVNVVNTVNATAVKLSTDKFTIKQGNSLYIKRYFKLVPADADAVYTMSSSDSDIVSVDNDSYYVYAHESGTATITVTATNKDDTIVTATATVTVKPLEITSMSFPKTEYKLTINKKNSVNLAAKVIVKPDTLKSYVYDEEEVIWESSDESVAKVSDSGYVTAVAPGTATITVTSIKNAKVTASTNVVVGKVDIKRIKLNKDTLNLTSGLYISKAFSVLVEPANAYVKEVYYKVDNTELITDLQVSESSSYSYVESELAYSKSLYFAIKTAEDKTGTAKVTVYVDDGTAVKTTTCTVNITAPKTTIAFDESKATIALYDTKEENKLNGYQLSVYNKKTGNTINPLDLTWKSSKKAVATVNRYGYVVPVKAGSTVITATTKDGNKTAIKATITVKQYKITGITGTAKRTLRVGDVKNVYSWVTIKPVGKVYNDTLKIASSNKKVIEVDDQGNLSAVAAGKSTITVTAKDGSKKSFKIVVNVIEAVK